MQDLLSFYNDQLSKHLGHLRRNQKRLYASSMLRVAIFFIASFSIYFFWGNTQLIIAVILVTIALFLWLVSRHSDLQYRSRTLKALIKINETELKVLQFNFHDLPTGDEFKDSQHYFSQDIDLFGRGSFYQYVNRTTLSEGSERLAHLMRENSIENILAKQKAIKELAEIPEWRQEFSAIASLTKTGTSSETIVKWLNKYLPFIPGIMKILPWIFSLISISLLAFYFTDFIPESLLVGWWILGMGIIAMYIKKIIRLSEHASKTQSTFQQYNQLLAQIENTTFTSELLRSKKQEILSDNEKTSTVIKQFSKLLYNVEKGNNLIYAIFVNGFFLRTLTHCHKVEEWIQKHGDSVEKWFETIAFFDAYNSLGNVAFNHPNYSYPVLTGHQIILKSKEIGHPLIPAEKCVLNDFEIDQEQFFIITGANMAGKSTFLRTVSLQIMMANMGLPVYASEVLYTPIKLITSMRTTDSLTDDESYFFSELKRLKYIVDEIKKDHYFIVLDEILKGTNSTDKAIGSKKFIEKLVSSKSTGIIATHDLSLCETAKETPQVKNYYFDAEIVEDELHFDYTLKKGICKNMNASFLLKKMEIVN